MKKGYFHIAVAIPVGVFFLTVTVAHACIGTVATRGAHEHGNMHSPGPMQTSHTEAQDEMCRSLRDRLISLAPQPSQSHSLVSDLNTIPAMGEPMVAEIQAFTAERPPGSGSIADDQPPLYIFNSVFRI